MHFIIDKLLRCHHLEVMVHEQDAPDNARLGRQEEEVGFLQHQPPLFVLPRTNVTSLATETRGNKVIFFLFIYFIFFIF